MKNIFRFTSLLAIMSVLIGGTIACNSEPSTTPEQDAILAYADPATETTLQG